MVFFFVSDGHHTWKDISEDVVRAETKYFIEEIDAFEVASAMYEDKDLTTEEHDSVISKYKRTLQARELMKIVLKGEKIYQFIDALECTGHRDVLEEIRYRQTISGKPTGTLCIKGFGQADYI